MSLRFVATSLCLILTGAFVWHRTPGGAAGLNNQGGQDSLGQSAERALIVISSEDGAAAPVPDRLSEDTEVHFEETATGNSEPLMSRGLPTKVETGDSLRLLASDYLGSSERWHELYELNRDRIKRPELLYAGMTLYLPEGIQPMTQDERVRRRWRRAMADWNTEAYTVAPGDTLQSIAADKLKNAGRWQEIYYLNDLDGVEPHQSLTLGQVIRIPVLVDVPEGIGCAGY